MVFRQFILQSTQHSIRLRHDQSNVLLGYIIIVYATYSTHRSLKLQRKYRGIFIRYNIVPVPRQQKFFGTQFAIVEPASTHTSNMRLAPACYFNNGVSTVPSQFHLNRMPKYFAFFLHNYHSTPLRQRAALFTLFMQNGIIPPIFQNKAQEPQSLLKLWLFSLQVRDARIRALTALPKSRNGSRTAFPPPLPQHAQGYENLVGGKMYGFL